MDDNSAVVKILIAEDNELSQTLMSGILTSAGYETVGAADGSEAIARIKEHNIDLALVDLNMEPTGGFEFMQHLVSEDTKIPVIIITADNSSDILIRANELGVARVLQKPVEPDLLKNAVTHVLRRYRR